MAEILNRLNVAKMNHENQTVRTMKVYKNHGQSILGTKDDEQELRDIAGRKVRLTLSKSSPLYAGSGGQAVLHQKIEDAIKNVKKGVYQ